jgi:hypothetical protein
LQEEKRAGLSFDALRFAQLIKQWTTEAINLINDVFVYCVVVPRLNVIEIELEIVYG